MDEALRRAALAYHRKGAAGKIGIELKKSIANRSELALAYSPGVAAACEAIVKDPHAAVELTARGNLVAVISNGTAVLGLGAIGALASKPVMEGKAMLFKKLADVDAFDLEIEATEVDAFCRIVEALEPTFGAINLEDIKSPECFIIEERLRARMRIPVFHDDQHGTAVACAAALLNALVLQGKSIENIKLVTAGAGAAALACVDMLMRLGLPPANIILTDKDGVVYGGRDGVEGSHLQRYACRSNARWLSEALEGADIFLGLSAPNVLRPEWLSRMVDKPIILAMANPDPEIRPEEVHKWCPDAIIATGRSDYPNQVNNGLCFPYIFRGALDVGASTINEPMKVAAARAIARLARQNRRNQPMFGPDHIVPDIFDPDLLVEVSSAVAVAAMESCVARHVMPDLDRYRYALRARQRALLRFGREERV